MGEQSASRLGGDDFQHLYSWYLILGLLDPESPYESAVVEHPEAGAADDVTLHPHDEVEDPSQYHQVKWHVDYRGQYSFQTIAEGSRGSSLLSKLHRAWRRLRDEGPLEIWLVSNWSAAPTSGWGPDLGAYIRDDSLALADEFFTKGQPSPAAKARNLWGGELGVDGDEVERFARTLRFRLSFSSSSDLRSMLDDRLGRFGLVSGDQTHALLSHDLRERIKQGSERKRLTRDTVLEVIASRRLRQEDQGAPGACIWLHGWVQQQFEAPPTVVVDWTAHFDRKGRRIPTSSCWERDLLPELDRVSGELQREAQHRFVDVRGRMPLSAALALGSRFPHVAGFALRVQQPTSGADHLWRTDSPASDNRFQVVSRAGQPGTDVALGLSVSGEALSDLVSFCDSRGFDAYVYCEPAHGTGPQAVSSENDLSALAESAKSMFQLGRRDFKPERLHIIYYGPVSLALAIGQHLNALGTVISYERTEDGGYQKSVVLKTG